MRLKEIHSVRSRIINRIFMAVPYVLGEYPRFILLWQDWNWDDAIRMQLNFNSSGNCNSPHSGTIFNKLTPIDVHL